jgi:2-aminoadipate transaminase
MSYGSKYSDNALNMRQSPIRELLRNKDLSKLISFAGGYPNPHTFPIDQIKEIMVKVIVEQGETVLQYSATEGLLKLRKILAERYLSQGLDIDHENVIITTSSQQAIDLTTKVFVNPGDNVICGLPSYLGALQSFYSYRANIIGLKNFEGLEDHLQSMSNNGTLPKFIYTIPDFQNPSGETLSVKQRENLISLAGKYDLLLIEDSPYREIRYEGEDLPMLYSMDNERVILFGTFSKTFAPGFRIGYIIAPKEICRRIAIAKQSTDLCSPVFDQAVVAEYISEGLFDSNLLKTKEFYRAKRDFILDCFEKYMPEYVSWTNPDGGIFLFVTLPDFCDTNELFKLTLEENVAFVAGSLFHSDGSGKNTMRINFSFLDFDKTETGVQILARCIKTYVESKKI